MLVEIRCEHFRKGPVYFHKGLNAVVGDSAATNSIGKSSLLMIVDFAHGGEGYILHNKDTVKVLGHHSFYITFEFNGIKYYFIRDTSAPEYVKVCDSEFNVDKIIGLYTYNAMLKKMYNLDYSDVSFREMVGRYSRVWGKNNYFVDKPLHGHMNANMKDTSLSLVHLFGKYEEIATIISHLNALELELKEAKSTRNALKIPKLSKSKHIENKEKIKQIDNSITEIKNNLAKFAINLKEIINEEVIKIKTRKDALLEVKYDLSSKLNRIEQGLNNNRHITSKSFNQVLTVIPLVNKKRLEDIELFHSKMSRILKNELLEGRERLLLQLEPVRQELAELDRQLVEATNIENPSIIVDHTIELLKEGGQLRTIASSYELIEELISKVKVAKSESDQSLDRILAEISFKLNDAMKSIVEFVYYIGHKSPVISAKSSGYQFHVIDDTGTGTAYSNILVFDLAVFSETKLPFIIHDSHLFKNVQNSAVTRLVKKYCEFERQSFIALDEVAKYGAEAKRTLLSMAVVQLSNKETLFNKDWRPKSSKDAAD